MAYFFFLDFLLCPQLENISPNITHRRYYLVDRLFFVDDNFITPLNIEDRRTFFLL